MATIGDVLRISRETLGLSQDEVASKIRKATGEKFSRSALSQIESGATKNPKPQNLQAACDALGIDFRAALAGKITRKDEVCEPAHEYVFDVDNRTMVPVVGSAQLGDNGYWSEIDAPVGHGDGYIKHQTRDKNAYAIRCYGDSMKPRIKEGEFVIIEPNTEAQPGDEVVIRAKDGRVMVKTLLFIRDQRVHLMSVNEAYPPQSIPIEEVEVMHYVAAIAKKNSWIPD